MVWFGVAVSILHTPGRFKTTLEKPGNRKIKTEMNKKTVVLIEPDISVRDALTVLLEGENWRVLSVEKCHDLATVFEDSDVVAVISEASLPGCTPQEIFEQCSRQEIPVIFTGHDLSLQSAVDLIRQGAMDFLDKPFPQSRLLDLLDGLENRQDT